MMLPGRATAEATGRYAARHGALSDAGFYRMAQGLRASSLGIGSYLGKMSDDVDDGYVDAMLAAVRSGINFIDTSLNYRHQRSERAIGQAIKGLTSRREIDRDEIIVCTKAGYLVPGAVPPDLPPDEIAGGMHSLSPDFLRDQLQRSLENLRLETIDVFYLHNPETQLQYVAEEVFYTRIRTAFETAEDLAEDNRIAFYGTATWPGFRGAAGSNGLMSLSRMAEIAREIAGDRHHFRFIQLPLNLAMTEGFTLKNQALDGKPVSVLTATQELGMTAIASATLLQARLSHGLPEQLHEVLIGLNSDAQRAIQFTRSTPGIAVALVGMSRPEHVRENIRVAEISPLDESDYVRMFGGAA
jgi:aryl-alcohol dehydrogenase-like predicted oxidoreductase